MISKERNKVLKIMDELNKYFIENTDTCHITSTLDFNKETKIRFRVHLNNKEEIERVKAKLEKIFSVQRYREVEELYWNLTGDSYSSDETNLVGMMVDEFSIEVEDNVLILYLIRR
ncbi:hypothetical protein PL321_00835 [Caloramator sp. mosi_1]|uniref:hypothetical protein n=1 Tax=Caloramator sp. mosi_1 TaxID=3023090 RepID=UPI002362F25F|nr:hypothetical protein [Caloramator sp. mosi_1]WDC84403.1 hypothetical protein PL321_00835 [Caloramator sp. mosi_1]